MFKKAKVYYCMCNIRHDGKTFKVGEVITGEILNEFAPEDIERLVSSGYLTTNREQAQRKVERIREMEKQFELTENAQKQY